VTAAGWAFMTLSVGGVLCLVVFCFHRVIRRSK
jgi:hypothetical protein